MLAFPRNVFGLILAFFAFANWACQFGSKEKEPAVVSFSEVTSEVALNTERNWKYGGPTIADLDCNGRYDLLLGNHDTSPVQLFWGNMNARFSEQSGVFPLADLHGTAAGDYDQDGDLDLLLSLGGGNGSSPQPQRLLRNDNGTFIDVTVQAGWSEMGARGRSVRWIDLDADGDLDFLQINAEPMKNEIIPRNILYENKGDGTFSYRKSEAFEKIDAERLLITDFNKDLIPDLVCFSPYSPIQFWQGHNDFTFSNVSQEWMPRELQNATSTMTACSFDIDNDGDLDYYFARGKSTYQIGNNALSYDERIKRLDLRDEGNQSHDGITFYAEDSIVLLDFYRFPRGRDKPTLPLFVGKEKTKFEMPVKSKTINKNEARGFPKQPNESGWYLGYLGEGKWRLEWLLLSDLAWDVRASIIGVTAYETEWESQSLGVQDILLINEGNRFKNASSNLPEESYENNQGVIAGDFDNDGRTDLFIYRFGHLKKRVEDALYMNKDDGLFKSVSGHGAASATMGDCHGDMGAAFDYNLDGRVDILSGDDDNGRWHLYQNTSNSENKFVLLQIGNSDSGIDAYGASVRLTTSTGEQFKSIGSGSASHSQSFLNTVHFGLGKETCIDQIQVVWRSGESETIKKLDVNQIYQIGKIMKK